MATAKLKTNGQSFLFGEQAYEIGAFMCNPLVPLSQEIIDRRLDQFNQLLQIDRKRLAQCAYVRIILSVCWSLQHGFNIPENYLQCAEFVFTYAQSCCA